MSAQESTEERKTRRFGGRVPALLAFIGLAIAVFGAGFALQFFVIADDVAVGETESGVHSVHPTEAGTFRLPAPAVLAQHSGDVALLEPPNTRLPTTLGQVVETGTLVRLEPEAKATFLAEFGAVVMTAGGVDVIEEPALKAPELADVWKGIVEYHRSLPTRFDQLITSGRLARVPNGLEFDAPFGTSFEPRPLFSWRDKDDAYPYTIVVRRPGSADPIWGRTIAGPTDGAMRIAHPEQEEPLPRGEPLEVAITSADGRSARGEFRLASAEERASIQNAITTAANALPELSVANFFVAHAYLARGCPQLASTQFLALSRLFPTERYPLEIQALIRFEAGHEIEARSIVRKLESMPMPIPLAITPTMPDASPAAPRAPESTAPGSAGAGVRHPAHDDSSSR